MKKLDIERLAILFEEDFIYQFVECIDLDYNFTKLQLDNLRNKLHVKDYRAQYVWYLFNYKKKS